MNSPYIYIDKRKIGGSEPLYLIADIGVNHENNLATAKEMIKEAADAGADAIKFQSYKAERLASKQSPAYWDQNKEPAESQYQLFKKYDGFGAEEYRELAEDAKKCGISFMTTVFDLVFLDELKEILPVYKIASADITNYPLIKKIAEQGKPVIMSAGAATLAEIDNALRLLKSNGCSDICLMHCVLNYPCLAVDANLKSISTLKTTFPDIVVGYSDHVPPEYSCLQLSIAWMLGALVVEKHFTLDKNLPGNDHYHAMDPNDIREFKRQHQYVKDLLYGNGVGDFKGQENARKYARRSLVAACDIKKGEKLTPDRMIAKRPGTGISPEYFDIVVNSATTCEIPENTPLQWDMILSK